MSSIPEVNPHNHFSLENYQRKYTNTALVSQIALGTIIAVGITIALTSHFGCIGPVFIKIGTGVAITSALVSLGVFVFGKKNNLREALADVRSVADLQQLCQNIDFRKTYCLDCYSWIGASIYLNVVSKDISGFITTDEIKNKIEYLERRTSQMNSQESQHLNNLRQEVEDKVFGVNL